MDELISKRAVIEAIEKARANVGHNLERSIGKSIIEILDDVGEDVGKLPSALSTNLAEVGTDCISRQAAQTELQLSARRYTVAHEAHGEGQVVWSEDLISVSDAMDVLRKIPSAQPTFDARDTQYNIPIGTDCINRQQAIDALKAIKYGLWEIDIPSPTVPEYVEHHEQIKNMMEIVDGWIERIQEEPPIQPTDNLQKLADEIASFKRCVKSDNSDYLTGYLCALSVVEGMIADMREVTT